MYPLKNLATHVSLAVFAFIIGLANANAQINENFVQIHNSLDDVFVDPARHVCIIEFESENTEHLVSGHSLTLATDPVVDEAIVLSVILQQIEGSAVLLPDSVVQVVIDIHEPGDGFLDPGPQSEVIYDLTSARNNDFFVGCGTYDSDGTERMCGNFMIKSLSDRWPYLFIHDGEQGQPSGFFRFSTGDCDPKEPLGDRPVDVELLNSDTQFVLAFETGLVKGNTDGTGIVSKAFKFGNKTFRLADVEIVNDEIFLIADFEENRQPVTCLMKLNANLDVVTAKRLFTTHVGGQGLAARTVTYDPDSQTLLATANTTGINVELDLLATSIDDLNTLDDRWQKQYSIEDFRNHLGVVYLDGKSRFAIHTRQLESIFGQGDEYVYHGLLTLDSATGQPIEMVQLREEYPLEMQPSAQISNSTLAYGDQTGFAGLVLPIHENSNPLRSLNLFLTGRYTFSSQNCCTNYVPVTEMDTQNHQPIAITTEPYDANIESIGVHDAIVQEPQIDTICFTGFPTPWTFNLFRGITVSGGVPEIRDSDDERAVFRPGPTLTSEEPPVWLEFVQDVGNTDLIQIRVESHANTPGLTKRIEAFNWTSNEFDILTSQSESFNLDSVLSYDITDPQDLLDYVNGGQITVRAGWRQTGPVLVYPWYVRVDQVAIESACSE